MLEFKFLGELGYSFIEDRLHFTNYPFLGKHLTNLH